MTCFNYWHPVALGQTRTNIAASSQAPHLVVALQRGNQSSFKLRSSPLRETFVCSLYYPGVSRAPGVAVWYNIYPQTLGYCFVKAYFSPEPSDCLPATATSGIMMHLHASSLM